LLSSSLCLPSAGITGVHHYTWLWTLFIPYFYNKHFRNINLFSARNTTRNIIPLFSEWKPTQESILARRDSSGEQLGVGPAGSVALSSSLAILENFCNYFVLSSPISKIEIIVLFWRFQHLMN
jgi:hypothetical protein